MFEMQKCTFLESLKNIDFADMKSIFSRFRGSKISNIFLPINDKESQPMKVIIINEIKISNPGMLYGR